MPPQNTQAPSPGPEKFEFMLKDQPKPPGRFGSFASWMPKPAKIALAGVGVLFVLVILYTLFFGGKTTNTDQLNSVMSRAQEITRVSTLAQQQAPDASTRDLATTTVSTLTSQQKELSSFLTKNNVKVDPKRLLAGQDKTTDTQLAEALKNNSYDQVYLTYLKNGLTSYQSELSAAFQDASTSTQAILGAHYKSVETLLSAPQLKN